MKYLKNYLTALILPLLFGFFPLLFLYAQNAEEMMIQNLVIPILQVIGFAVVVTAVIGFILKSFFKAGIIAALLLFSYFSFGHIVRILPVIKLVLGNLHLDSGHFLLLFWILALIPVIILIIRSKRDLKKITTLLTIIGAFLVLIQVVQAGFILISRKNVVVAEESTPEVKKTKSLPDIYYIVMDAYGGSAVLKDIYGVDNSSLITFLKETGFYVPDESYSHYCQTIFSLGAILNMNYINTLGKFDPESNDRMPVSLKLRHNQVVKSLRCAGYSIVAFASGYEHTEFTDADLYIEPSGTMNEFENVLLSTTMFPLVRSGEDSLFAKHRKRVLYIMDKLPKITEVKSPKFVFAHIISPHPPFIFDETGHPVQQSNSFHLADGSHYMNSKGGGKKNYLKGYSGQVTYITELIKIMIKKIIEGYPGNKPVIILQADHGPGSRLNWESLEKTDVRERFSILHAYYFPGQENKPSYNNISPINMFRVLFNAYLGTRFELLPKKSYFTRWSHPYDFYDVTDRLWGKK
ncbi:MAG: hypothetical protein JXB88_01895 [Spirochaetales bacterium]|nr:hypothetical protein [Spirochaetales bacterium]